MNTHPTETILCEGQSELVYVQEVNRILCRNNFSAAFYAKLIGNGLFSNVIKAYKKEHRTNRKGIFYAWVDFDLYHRNEKQSFGQYERHQSNGNSQPKFLFSRMNFEDFLALHCEDPQLNKWLDICEENNHFSSPMTAAVCTPLFTKNIFPNYKKGTLPFALSKNKLETMFSNLNKTQIQNDFGKHLLEELEQGKLRFKS